MKQIRVAAVSTINEIGEQEKAIANIASWAEKAAKEEAEFIVFPELCVSGYLHSTHALKFAEPVPGPSTEKLIQVAGDIGVTICYGILENRSDIVFNTQVVVDGNGILGLQRKLHMPGNEYLYWRGGFDVNIIDIGKARVGIMICYDANFPELARTLFLKGAEILVMPFAYGTPGERSDLPERDISVMTYRVQCHNNGCYGIVANNAGSRPRTEIEDTEMNFPGWAGVFGPYGDVVEWTRDKGNDEAMVVADLEPDRLIDRRRDVYFMPRCLRPAIYQSLEETLET